MSHMLLKKGELTVLPQEVEVDPDHLPHEFTVGTDSFGESLIDCSVGDVDQLLKQLDTGLEMENPYPPEHSSRPVHPHSLRPTKAVFDKPEIPPHIIDEAIRAKVSDIAKQIEVLKGTVKSILLTDDIVHISIIKRDENLTIPLTHPDFFKVVAYFLFASEMNYNTRLAVIYSKGNTVLLSEKRSVFELYNLFRLNSTVHDLRKKLAIHRKIANRLEDVQQKADNIRIKGTNGEAILRELDDAQDVLGGFAQIYNTEAYVEIERIRKEVATHSRNWDKEVVIAT